MVTYDQYEQPDFSMNLVTALEAASGARRLRFVPRRGKSQNNTLHKL